MTFNPAMNTQGFQYASLMDHMRNGPGQGVPQQQGFQQQQQQAQAEQSESPASPAQDEDEVSVTGSKRRRGGPPPMVACLACRNAKCKCVRADPAAERCDRCARGKLDCVLVKHQRGRKFGSGAKKARTDNTTTSTSERRRQSSSPSSSSHPPPNILPDQTSSFSLQAILRPSETSPSEPALTHTTTGHALAIPANTARGNDATGNVFAPSVKPQPTGTAGAGGQRLMSIPFSVVEKGWNDPISLAIMTEKMAVELCSFFFTHLNILANVLDPNLNDVPTLRPRSAFLFTAILCCASRFHRTEYNTPCRALLRQHALRSFDEHIKKVDVVQAFYLMTHWKHSTDDRTWTYLGYALRLAVELGMDKTQRLPGATPGALPAEEAKRRREARSMERTWLSLYASEQSLCSLLEKVPMCNGSDPLVSKSSNWHRDSLALPGDAILNGFVQLRILASKTLAVLKTFPSRDDPTVFLRAVNRDIDLWESHWRAEMSTDLHKMYVPLIRFYSMHIKLFLNSYNTHSHAKQSPINLSDCYWAGMKALEAVLDMEKHGLLRFVQDNANVMSSFAAIKVVKLITEDPLVGTEAEQDSVALILAASKAFARASRGPNDTALLQSQFLEKLVQQIQDERVIIADVPPQPQVPVAAGSPVQEGPRDYLEPGVLQHPQPQVEDWLDPQYNIPLPSPAVNNYQQFNPAPLPSAEESARYFDHMLATLGIPQDNGSDFMNIFQT